jgi:hypothetical protein
MASLARVATEFSQKLVLRLAGVSTESGKIWYWPRGIGTESERRMVPRVGQKLALNLAGVFTSLAGVGTEPGRSWC